MYMYYNYMYMYNVRLQAFAMCCKELCPSVGEECTEHHIVSIFII